MYSKYSTILITYYIADYGQVGKICTYSHIKHILNKSNEAFYINVTYVWAIDHMLHINLEGNQ